MHVGYIHLKFTFVCRGRPMSHMHALHELYTNYIMKLAYARAARVEFVIDVTHSVVDVTIMVKIAKFKLPWR